MPKPKPPTTLKRLTAGQQSALSLILSLRERNGAFPSLADMAAAAGYTRQAASDYRAVLAHKGWIKLATDGTILSAVQPMEGYKVVEAKT